MKTCWKFLSHKWKKHGALNFSDQLKEACVRYEFSKIPDKFTLHQFLCFQIIEIIFGKIFIIEAVRKEKVMIHFSFQVEVLSWIRVALLSCCRIKLYCLAVEFAFTASVYIYVVKNFIDASIPWQNLLRTLGLKVLAFINLVFS